MKNLLKETEVMLKKHGKTWDDVQWVGEQTRSQDGRAGHAGGGTNTRRFVVRTIVLHNAGAWCTSSVSLCIV